MSGKRSALKERSVLKEQSVPVNQPIGVFDSGVGGLSVLTHIHQLLPHEHLLYIADTACMPYGCKSIQVVQDRCIRITNFLAEQECKAVVIACNTATAAAIHQLRAMYSFPIIGMEPAIKPAIQQSRSNVIGILATTGTLGSEKFQRLQQRFATDAKIIVQPCPGLVEQIEQGEFENESTRALLQPLLQPLLQQDMDTLVLGCTHYPFVIGLIREIVGSDIGIIDCGAAIARQLQRQLLQVPTFRHHPQQGSVEFRSTGDVQSGSQLMSRLWGEMITVKAVSF